MTRYAEPVSPRLPDAPIAASPNLILPVVEVLHYERVVLQWRLSDPPAPRTIGGVVTDWRFYKTAFPRQDLMDRDTGQFFDPLARPDLWELDTSIAFPALPSGALATASTTWYCAGYTALASVIDVATPLDTMVYTRSAFGP